jgi:tetratricopeptide (TPR) repeat protein
MFRGLDDTIHKLITEPAEPASLPDLRNAEACDPVAKSELAMVYHILGRAYHQQGDLAAARPWYLESLAVSRELGDKWNVALPLLRLGRLAWDEGDWTAAHDWYTQTLETRSERGDRLLIANALVNLGDVAYASGSLQQAAVHYREALALLRDIGRRRGDGRHTLRPCADSVGWRTVRTAGTLVRDSRGD